MCVVCCLTYYKIFVITPRLSARFAYCKCFRIRKGTKNRMASTTTIPVVMDIGSDSCKVGFAGEDNPKKVVPSVVGQHKQADGSAAKRHVAGQDALEAEDALTLKYPVERGVITDLASMEVLLDYIFKEILSTKSTDHPVLVSETPKNPKENREKMAELMFEKFQVPAFFSSCQAVMCLYSSGRSSGLVLDIGAGVTTAVPVYEGYSLSESVVRRDFAGNDITEHLARLLSGRGYQFTSVSDKTHLKEMKEKLCYVSRDVNTQATEKSPDATYRLPDGKVISLDSERFQCTELLLQPGLAGLSDQIGIHQMVNKAISTCEMDTKKSLYTNVILSGGSSLFDGIAERLKSELKAFGPLGAEARVIAHKDRLVSAWSGGSVLASLSSFENKWIHRKEYEEVGSKVVHSRCF